ncbi:MAG: leucyl aminopeptidase, partial [Lachnospiraceae bacterium]|nr:leucyl aminopeptidase [Lachnospiraceae bacterium]
MEDIYISEADREDLERERYALAMERIREIPNESICEKKEQAYFGHMAEFVLLADRAWNIVESGRLRQMSLEELQDFNRELYADILPEHYDTSYGNPDYAVDCLGESIGKMFSFLYAELRGMIPAAFEQNRFDMVIRAELLLEVYQVFAGEEQEQDGMSKQEALQQILYWYVSDYYEPASLERTAGMLCPDKD